MSEGRIAGRGQRVEIWTDKYRLVGHVFVPEVMGGSPRLSDVLNHMNKPFLSLSRVIIYRRGDDAVALEQDFLMVNRDSIEVIRPLD